MANAAAPKLGCLIMAAGNASRFGANKLFAAYRGTSLLELAFLAVPPGLFSCVTVVSQYEKALELAAQYGFTAILNDAPELGVSRTIFLGTQAMLDCDAILYMVADQPLLQPNSVCAVAERWTREPGCIVGAAHNGKRGNPCIFPKKLFPSFSRSRATPAAAASSGSTKTFFASSRFRPKSSMTATPSLRSTR